MKGEKLYLGTDVGGTNIVAGVVTSGGVLLARSGLPTPRSADAVVGAIASSCRAALAACGRSIHEIQSLGVGVPGTVVPDGTVSYACNLDMRDVPLAHLLSSRLDLPVFLENDANCAAVGEYLAGCGCGAASLLCVTIGTGIGAGFVEGGRLWRGANGCALEAGHMVIQWDGIPCACGRKGCFERYASTSALIARCRDYIRQNPGSPCARIAEERGAVDGQTVFLAMDAGDDGARAVFDAYTAALSCGLTNLVNLLQPQVLCLGGGISAQGERLLAPVRKQVLAEDYARDCPARVTVLPAALGNDAGIIGAALLGTLRENGENA